MCQQAASKLPERYWFPEDHTSQVLERPLALAPTLAWLEPTADRLGHLDFWVHTTLSLRNAASDQRDPGQSAALDFPAEQLKAVRAQVAGRLPSLLAGAMRSDVESFIAPLEEFVLAQRLARAALAGRLGHDFPLQRLPALERETRPFVTTQPTVRWEARGLAAHAANATRTGRPGRRAALPELLRRPAAPRTAQGTGVRGGVALTPPQFSRLASPYLLRAHRHRHGEARRRLRTAA